MVKVEEGTFVLKCPFNWFKWHPANCSLEMKLIYQGLIRKESVSTIYWYCQYHENFQIGFSILHFLEFDIVYWIMKLGILELS